MGTKTTFQISLFFTANPRFGNRVAFRNAHIHPPPPLLLLAVAIRFLQLPFCSFALTPGLVGLGSSWVAVASWGDDAGNVVVVDAVFCFYAILELHNQTQICLVMKDLLYI